MESCTLSRRSIIFLTVFCDCPSPEQLYYFYFQYHDLFNVKMRIIIFLIYMSLNGQNYKASKNEGELYRLLYIRLKFFLLKLNFQLQFY